MNKNSMSKLLSFILCMVLIAAMALIATGCSDKTEPPKETLAATEATQAPATTEVTTKGEGKTAFNFEVTDIDGKTTKFLIKTDKTIVADALLELELIEESKESAGLFVTVNGISADYNKDGAWWQFFINGESATKGVDQTVTNVGRLAREGMRETDRTILEIMLSDGC